MKCPRGNDECEHFGQQQVFCPFATFEQWEERQLFKDCEFAPVQVWRDMRTREERLEYLKEVLGEKTMNLVLEKLELG